MPEQYKPVVATLTRLYDTVAPTQKTLMAKRKLEDVNKKVGALFERLNQNDISAQASEKLVRLCQALDQGDYNTAGQYHVALTSSDWDENGIWIVAVKRLMDTAAKMT